MLLLVRQPAFGRLWLAGLISKTGDWLLLIAMPIFLLQLTGSGLASAAVLVVELVVRFFFGQFAGLLVDAVDRWLLLRLSMIAQGICLTPLLLVDSPASTWLVLLVAGAEAALGVLVGVTLGAMMPDLVEENELVAANGVFSVMSDVARLLGAVAGGVVLAWSGMAGVVVVDAVSFVLAAAVLAARPAARTRADADGARDGLSLRAWRDGVRQIRSSRHLTGGVVITCVVTLAFGISQLALIVWVLDRLRGSAVDVGVLRAAVGVGTLAGGVVLSTVGGRLAAHRLTGLSMLAVGFVNMVVWNAPAFTTAIPVYVALMALSGLPGVGAFIGLSSVLQSHTSSADRGKVFGLLSSANSAAQGVGLLIGGALVDVVSPALLLNCQAGLMVAGGVAAIIWLRDRPAAGAPSPLESASQVRS